MPRVKATKRKQQHAPLAVDLENDSHLNQFGTISKPGKRPHKSRNTDENDRVEVSFHYPI